MQLTTTEIMGGLGNQLFQIFNLLAYSLRYRTPFYFSQEPIKHGQRKQTYWQSLLLQALKPFVKAPSSPSPAVTLSENGFQYQPISFYEQDHMKLFGYFQSYKYFEDQEANIYKLIKLDETKAAIKAKTNYAYARTLAVHFRVGDYVQLPNHHPLMPINYYIKALDQFIKDQTCEAQAAQAQTQSKETTSEPWHILYFCEEKDQPYVETQLIQPLQADPLFRNHFTFQCINHHLADWEQLIVMSLCQHHIIANSTFSWWGAYLGGINREGQNGGVGARPHVYYPTTWFGPAIGYKNMNDLFPPHWQKIII